MQRLFLKLARNTVKNSGTFRRRLYRGEIQQSCNLQHEGGVLSLSKHQSLMQAAMSQMILSARAYNRILKLARTIADLAGSEEIQSANLAETLQYGPKLLMR